MIESRSPNDTEPDASVLAMVTQPAISAGSAMAIAKNEFQKPSAEMSSRRKPSGLPIIIRQAASEVLLDFLDPGHAQPNHSSRKRL